MGRWVDKEGMLQSSLSCHKNGVGCFPKQLNVDDPNGCGKS